MNVTIIAVTLRGRGRRPCCVVLLKAQLKQPAAEEKEVESNKNLTKEKDIPWRKERNAPQGSECEMKLLLLLLMMNRNLRVMAQQKLLRAKQDFSGHIAGPQF